MWSIMSKILDMFLNLIHPRKPFAPLTGARVFAAVYGAVVKLGGILCISMSALGMPFEILSLGEAFEAA
jgi:hypothetical protein